MVCGNGGNYGYEQSIRCLCLTTEALCYYRTHHTDKNKGLQNIQLVTVNICRPLVSLGSSCFCFSSFAFSIVIISFFFSLLFFYYPFLHHLPFSLPLLLLLFFVFLLLRLLPSSHQMVMITQPPSSLSSLSS